MLMLSKYFICEYTDIVDGNYFLLCASCEIMLYGDTWQTWQAVLTGHVLPFLYHCLSSAFTMCSLSSPSIETHCILCAGRHEE